MIGHPSETIADVQAIADLCKRVLAEGRKVLGKQSQGPRRGEHFHPQAAYALPVGLSRHHRTESKPSRPCSCMNCGAAPSNSPGRHPRTPCLEGWLSRGDRRMAEVNLLGLEEWDENSMPGRISATSLPGPGHLPLTNLTRPSTLNRPRRGG